MAGRDQGYPLDRMDEMPRWSASAWVFAVIVRHVDPFCRGLPTGWGRRADCRLFTYSDGS
jgi:hypothetical protein